MRIRAMTEADLDAVLAIASALPSAPHWPRETYAAALDSESWPQRVALVGESEGSVAAGEGEIESIAVASGEQRRGIGATLLRALLDALTAAGALATVLEVRESNRVAAGLYARAGFCEIGRRTGYYRDPVEDAVLMRLELSQVP